MIKTYNIKDISVSEILRREEESRDVSGSVAEIIKNVRERGDAALAEYTEKFDRVTLGSIIVSDEEINEAIAQVDAEFLDILKESAVHAPQQTIHSHILYQASVISLP